MSEIISESEIPLCVDLDGTLLKSDLLYESIAYLLKKNIFYFFLIPFWFFKGRYFIKYKLHSYLSPNIKSMTYNNDIINFIKKEKTKGRKIILVTATVQSLAEKVAEHLMLFDEVIGSKDNVNLVGSNKGDYLLSLYGKGGFDYIGDSVKDLFVWKYCRLAHVVTKNSFFTESVAKTAEIGHVFDDRTNNFKVFLRQIRIHQWIKNLILFLPPLLAHKIDLQLFLQGLAGFIAFSLTSSGIYIINDIADLESDRNHTVKRHRPIASGEFKLTTSFKIIPLFILSGLLISYFTLGDNFTLILLTYTFITILYSFKLKKIFVFDIITLSLLYSIRLIAGGIATSTEISQWLFGFSMFIFLSLGAMKRYTELKGLIEENKTKTRGRDYYTEDIPLINIIGISAGMISTLIFILYIDNPEVIKLYNNPFYLYLITPVVLYWILRMWFIAHRGSMNEDPVVFALKDKTSYYTALAILLIALGATL